MELEKTKKELKKKKAPDLQGWRNEYITSAGKDLTDSILMMLNEVAKNQRVPNEWRDMIIKSIYKNKGNVNEMTNQRGLFLTSILSKVMEKIVYYEKEYRSFSVEG